MLIAFLPGVFLLSLARWSLLAAWLCLAACGASPDPLSYQLSHSGDHWDVVAGRDFIPELEERYPEYFRVILDPSDTREPDLRPLRDDLERIPSDARSYDALHALAVGYFELNYRANARPGGPTYLSDNFRAAKLVAVPWSAYGKVDDPTLRDAILDFFEDAGLGEKLGAAATAPRLARVVESLASKESQDIARRERIHELSARLAALQPQD
jgi:hypothetical protein